jgi:hypothetical protein
LFDFRLFHYLFQDHLIQDDLQGHGVAAAFVTDKEIAVTFPITVIEFDYVGIVHAVESHF